MSGFLQIFQNLVVRTLRESYQFITQAGPKLVLSLVIFLIGLVFALLLKKITSKLLKALGFDVLSEKAGLKRFLEKGGIQRNVSSLAGLGLYWLIIFSALIMVFNTLQLEAASRLIQQSLVYIPKIIVALILLALGIFLGQFFRKFVQASCRLANIPFPAALGNITRYLIIGLAIITALEYLNVPITIIVETFIFILLPLILCLVFLIGGRDIIASILAGRLLQKEYKSGDLIEFDSVAGQVQSIDLLTTKIKSKAGQIIIPNSELAKKIIKKCEAEEG